MAENTEITGKRVWILVEQLHPNHKPATMTQLKDMPKDTVYPKTEKVWMEGLATYSSDTHVTVDTGKQSFSVDPESVLDSKPSARGRKTVGLTDSQMQTLAKEYPEKW